MEFSADQLVRFALAGGATALLVAGALILRARRGGSGRVIRVVGIGGGGANAVEAMIRARMTGVDYVVVNTDVRALRRSSARTKIAIGKAITNGLGAGGDASVGETAARDGAEAIARALAGSDLVVITAGLGGGTGSGAASVVADIARQQGALTMAVVTKPFRFEGARRQQVAQRGAETLVSKADAVATVPNDRVRDLMPADVTVEDAFRSIDDVMRGSLGEIVDLVAVRGRINLDFADVRAVLEGGGAAVVGLGRASGANRATEATRAAMAATLLEGRIEGATSILLKVSGSNKLKLGELDDVGKTVLAAASPDANIVFGMSLDGRLRDDVQVTLIATGFDPARSLEGQGQADAPAGGTPTEWRPVWLRRSAEAGVAESVATPSHPSRRARRKAKRGGQTPLPATDPPALSEG